MIKKKGFRYERKIEEILFDDAKILKMSEKAKRVGDNKALERIDNEILKLIKK